MRLVATKGNQTNDIPSENYLPEDTLVDEVRLNTVVVGGLWHSVVLAEGRLLDRRSLGHERLNGDVAAWHELLLTERSVQQLITVAIDHLASRWLCTQGTRVCVFRHILVGNGNGAFQRRTNIDILFTEVGISRAGVVYHVAIVLGDHAVQTSDERGREQAKRMVGLPRGQALVGACRKEDDGENVSRFRSLHTHQLVTSTNNRSQARGRTPPETFTIIRLANVRLHSAVHTRYIVYRLSLRSLLKDRMKSSGEKIAAFIGSSMETVHIELTYSLTSILLVLYLCGLFRCKRNVRDVTLADENIVFLLFSSRRSDLDGPSRGLFKCCFEEVEHTYWTVCPSPPLSTRTVLRR